MQFARTILVVTALFLCSGQAMAADEVETAWSQATGLETSGRFVPAAQVLRPLADQYPQDYGLQLQVGWLYFRGGAYTAALTYYQRADALADSPGLARLGLGWAHLEMGHADLAEQAFGGYLEANPDNPANASEGLLRARNSRVKPVPWHVFVLANPVSLFTFSNHPERESGIGAGAQIGVSHGAFASQVTYNFSSFNLRAPGAQSQALSALGQQTGAGNDGGSGGNGDGGSGGNGAGGVRGNAGDGGGSGPGSNSSYSEHSVFGLAGFGGQRFGASIDAAAVSNANNLSNTIWAAGATFRLSFWNHIYAGAHYESLSGSRSYQAKLAYDIRLHDAFWITPTGVVQFPEAEDVLGTGKLSVSYRGRPVQAFVSARYGRVWHEVDFVGSIFASHDDDVVAGVAGGTTFWFAPNWGVGGTATWERYESHSDRTTSDGYFGSLFFTFTTDGAP